MENNEVPLALSIDMKRKSVESLERGDSQKKLKGLLEDGTTDDEASTSGDGGGVPIRDDNKLSNDPVLTVNHEYARRFEHNKKREELQRLEERYGKSSVPPKGNHKIVSQGDDNESLTDSSTDSEEDDEGILASEALDAQIQSTMEAIRKKDPRVYDEKVKFYTDPSDETQNESVARTKGEKPMYLSDYHRRNLLEATDDTSENLPITYAKQQDDLKNILVKEMHSTRENGNEEDRIDHEGDSDDGFLVPKNNVIQPESIATRPVPTSAILDIEAADRDPETFLNNFMSARAWVPSDNSKFQPFESDDEEDDRKAELFEEAYNLRFENPQTSNEKLLSHARDTAAKYSVRKEATNTRKRARELERTKKEAERRVREEGRARLRSLKLTEAEEKLRKIKDAAGMRGRSFPEHDWALFLEGAWDDTLWEGGMSKLFGNDFYANRESNASDDDKGLGKQKIKKPKWEDDIDIGDIVPEFEAEENDERTFILNGEVSNDMNAQDDLENVISNAEYEPKSKKSKERKIDEQKKGHRQRRKLEQIVDQQIDVDEILSNFSKKHAGNFRYRDTSPIAYGLTAQDILMASDAQLNQYAGLKKLAAFRDEKKKRKDKKHLGKKARLRQWRKDTFGNERDPQETFVDARAEGGPATYGKQKGKENGIINRVSTGGHKRKKARSKSKINGLALS